MERPTPQQIILAAILEGFTLIIMFIAVCFGIGLLGKAIANTWQASIPMWIVLAVGAVATAIIRHYFPATTSFIRSMRSML